MRIALELSGLPRIHPISAASWGRIIGSYQPDVYVHSWIEDDDNQDHVRSQLEWVFKPIGLLLEKVPDIDTSFYPDRHWPYIDVYRSLSMWNGISRVHGMVASSNVHYDLIIRGRMDLHIHRLDLVDFDGIVVPYRPTKLDLRFSYRGTDMHGLNDHLAYGKMHHMDRYASTLEQIPILYRDEMVDYCPENFLSASLAKQGVPIHQQMMQHHLIRG